MRALVLLLVSLITPAAAAELRGHGGPVRALAFTSEGHILISGSFDSTVITWTLAKSSAESVLRYHNGSVNAVAALPGGRFASAGEDGRIALWRHGAAAAEQV